MRIIFYFLIFWTHISRAQDLTDLSTNGAKRSTSVITNHPDHIPRFNAWAGFSIGPNAITFGGLSYLMPKRFFINSRFGSGGADFEGTIFFINWMKNKSLAQTVDFKEGGSVDTLYKVDIEVPKRKSLGLHFGGGTATYWFLTSERAESLFAGLTLFKHRYLSLRTKNSIYATSKGNSKFSLNLDFVKYYNHRPESSKYSIEDWGIRIYTEGFAGVVSRGGSFNMRYLLGIGTHAYKENWAALFGLGLSWTFLAPKDIREKTKYSLTL